MNQTDEYESLSYKIKFYRALRAGIITLVVALLVAAPSFWMWQQSIEKRRVFREAKNVVLNMNLLTPEFIAETIPVADSTALSGLSAQAEERVKSYSGAEGEIQLVSWDKKRGCPAAVNYKSGGYLVQYRYDWREEKETWEIFVRIDQYDNDKG